MSALVYLAFIGVSVEMGIMKRRERALQEDVRQAQMAHERASARVMLAARAAFACAGWETKVISRLAMRHVAFGQVEEQPNGDVVVVGELSR